MSVALTGGAKGTRARGTVRFVSSSASALFLALLGLSGYFKGVPWANRLIPVDLTLLGTALTLVAIIGVVLDRTRMVAVLIPVGLLWLTFVPGMFLAPDTPDASRKVQLLLTSTLLCCIGALVLDRRGLRIWLIAQIGAGAVMSFVVWLGRDQALSTVQGRLLSDDVTSISSARVVGSAALILVILIVQRRGWLVPGGLIVAGGLTLLLNIGSRGPVLSLGITLIVLVLTSRGTSQRTRVAAAAALAVVGYLFVSYVLSVHTYAAQRLSGLFTDQATDSGRQYLYRVAESHISLTPQGLGWGGFAVQPEVGSLVNATGTLYPHNFLLEIAVEGGWLALIGIVAFCVVTIWRLRRASVDPLARVAYALAVYWLLVAQTSSDINGNRMTWIALSIGLIDMDVLAPRLRRLSASDESANAQSASDPPNVRSTSRSG